MDLSKFITRTQPESVEAYLLATFCVAVAGGARWTVGLFVADVVPFATFFPATLFAALVGGIGPGVFAAVAGGILGWWAFINQPMSWMPLTVGQQISIVSYFITSFIIVWAANHYQRVARRLQQEEILRQLAVEELAHRLKNKVATIQSIVSLRLRDNPQARDEIINCLGSLRATDELILAAQGKGAHIEDILTAELQPYDLSRLTLQGPKVLLIPQLAMTSALIFHELATNAAKYGALSGPSGTIFVRWSLFGPLFHLEWRECDGPAVIPPAHSGFGTKLFQRALEQFDGKVEVAYEATGLVVKLQVPLPESSVSIVPSAGDGMKEVATQPSK